MFISPFASAAEILVNCRHGNIIFYIVREHDAHLRLNAQVCSSYHHQDCGMVDFEEELTVTSENGADFSGKTFDGHQVTAVKGKTPSDAFYRLSYEGALPDPSGDYSQADCAKSE